MMLLVLANTDCIKDVLLNRVLIKKDMDNNPPITAEFVTNFKLSYKALGDFIKSMHFYGE